MSHLLAASAEAKLLNFDQSFTRLPQIAPERHTASQTGLSIPDILIDP